MRKILLGIITAVVVATLMACGNSDSGLNSEGESKVAAPDKFLRIGTGPMGSGWYPITTVLAEVYMDNFASLNVSEVEGGSTANLKSLDQNDVQMAINYTSDFIDSLNGDTEFEKPYDSVAALGSLYPVYQTIATLKNNSNINKIEDIIDKHIFLGPQGGGGPVAFWRMMEVYGIDESTIKEAGGKFSYGNYSDGASMMKDGVVDVLIAGGAPMVPALQEIDVTNPIKILPIDIDKLEEIEKKGFGISFGNIPANTYKEQNEDIPTYTMITMATVRSDLDDDYVYHLTKFFWESLDKLAEQVPTRAEDITLETALNGLKKEHLHPGAAKYYQEVNLLEE